MSKHATPSRRYARDTEIAARYGISRNSVWRWAKEGRLPSTVKLGPGVTRWRLADIEQWEAEREAI